MAKGATQTLNTDGNQG